MKKIICLILAFILIFSLSACGENKNSGKKDAVDLEYYVSLGQIPEFQIALGDEVSKVKDTLSSAPEGNDEYYFEVINGKENVLLNNGSYNLFYKNDKEDKGISYIVSFETAFGIETGALIVEVKDMFSSVEFVEEKLTEDNAFFMWGVMDGSILKAEFDKYTVIFVFVDNSLTATAIYKTNDWK